MEKTNFQEESQNIWMAKYLAKWALIFLAFVLYTLVIARGAEAKAERKYEAWQERYISGFLAQQEAVKLGMPANPYEKQLDAEAQELAKVLYGVKDNSTDDMRTLCWCVFNRVDSRDYPDTLEEVISQPSQWMRYDPENPVIENIYNIAREELDAWHTGTTRPCGIDLVFMNWTPSEITLRNTWTNSAQTYYWRAGK